MIRYTERDMIKSVPSRWKLQYPSDRFGKQEALEGLNLDTCSASDVERIIGNNSWTREFCGECQLPQSDGVILGEHFICEECLDQCVKMLQS